MQPNFGRLSNSENTNDFESIAVLFRKNEAERPHDLMRLDFN